MKNVTIFYFKILLSLLLQKVLMTLFKEFLSNAVQALQHNDLTWAGEPGMIKKHIGDPL